MHRLSSVTTIIAAATLAGAAAAQQPADFAEVQGVWAASDEACAEAPWQIGEAAFTTGYVGASCSFDPAAQTAVVNASGGVTSFYTPSTCTMGEEETDWNMYFMLRDDGQLLWVSGSNALERTLVRCEEEAGAEGEAAGDEG